QTGGLIVLLLRSNKQGPDRKSGLFCWPLAASAEGGMAWGRSHPNHIAAAISRPCQSRALHLVSARFSRLFPADQDAVVAQLVRAPVCGTGGRWFEPTQLYQADLYITFCPKTSSKIGMVLLRASTPREPRSFTNISCGIGTVSNNGC